MQIADLAMASWFFFAAGAGFAFETASRRGGAVPRDSAG
jgi:hypothetical protein